MVCVQIEICFVIENVEVIVSVFGIDMLFIGFNDLVGFLGYVVFDYVMIFEV